MTGSSVARLSTALLSLLAVVVAATEEPAPLRDEDVVRMLVAGRSEAEIVEAIRAHPPDFDLSDEMVRELELAGVPASVIGAMRERQAETSEAGPQETDPDVAAVDVEPSRARLRVALVDDEAAERALVFPAQAFPAELAERHGLGSSPEDREVTDLAVFLACTTAVHVPDQWRTRSPVGRDFLRMPRHGILAFHAGAEQLDADRARRGTGWRWRPGELLRLELPAALTADLEPDLKHDLLLGIAGRIGNRWLVIDLAAREEVEVPAGGATLSASVRSRIRGTGVSLGVEFVE